MKYDGKFWAILIIGISLSYFAYSGGYLSFLGDMFTPTTQGTAVTSSSNLEQQTAFTTALLDSAQCPDTDLTTVTFNVFNKANTSASQQFPADVYVYKVINGVADTNAFTRITTTSSTGASSASLPCGEDWMAAFRSSSSAGGNNSRVLSASGDASAQVIDGNIFFSTKGGAETLSAKGTLHGTLEFQVYDEQNRGFLNENGDADTNAYQVTPADFEGTSNGGQIAIGTAGQVELTINYRTTQTDFEYNDRGYYVSVNASTSVYDVPTVRLNGAGGTTLPNVKGSLDQYCARAYSGEEYVYFADRDVPLNDKGQLYFSMFALSGVNPANSTDDFSISWHDVGHYQSITGNNVLKVGACDDSSTTANTFAVQTTAYDVS